MLLSIYGLKIENEFDPLISLKLFILTIEGLSPYSLKLSFFKIVVLLLRIRGDHHDYQRWYRVQPRLREAPGSQQAELLQKLHQILQGEILNTLFFLIQYMG